MSIIELLPNNNHNDLHVGHYVRTTTLIMVNVLMMFE